MANSKLLKEAIADAKAVKETALANAKLALAEAFTPRLQSILSKKMKAEAEEEDDDMEVANEELSSSEVGGGPTKETESPKSPKTLDADTDLSVGVTKDTAAVGSEDPNMPKSTKQIDEMGEDDFNFGGEEDDAMGSEEDPAMDKDAEIAELRARIAELEGGEDEFQDDNDPAADGFPGADDPAMDAPADGGFDPAADGGFDSGDGEDEEEDGMDLEAIIRELEAQLGGDEDEDPAMGDEPTDGGFDPSMGGEEEEDELPVAETLANGEEAGTDKGEDPKVVMTTESDDNDEDDKEDDSDVVDLDEILREMEADMKGSGVKQEANSLKLKSELKEAYDTIVSLQKTINEVNLLNAKLLFANKLFRAHNMTNEQKVKVIETLDRTKSVREVKLVFSTLAENLKYAPKHKITNKKSITEGMASRVVKTTKPTASEATGKSIISESVAQADRFKKLAGILK